jgi:hypothetical protein
MDATIAPIRPIKPTIPVPPIPTTYTLTRKGHIAIIKTNKKTVKATIKKNGNIFGITIDAYTKIDKVNDIHESLFYISEESIKTIIAVEFIQKLEKTEYGYNLLKSIQVIHNNSKQNKIKKNLMVIIAALTTLEFNIKTLKKNDNNAVKNRIADMIDYIKRIMQEKGILNSLQKACSDIKDYIKGTKKINNQTTAENKMIGELCNIVTERFRNNNLGSIITQLESQRLH